MRTVLHRRLAGIVLCIMLAATFFDAAAQRMIVLTTAMSASREAARVYAQAVDLGQTSVLPGPVALAGGEVLGDLTPLPRQGAMLVSTGRRRPGRALRFVEPPRLTLLRWAPFGALVERPVLGGSNWREYPALSVPLAGSEAVQLVTLGAEEEGGERSQGAAAVFTQDAQSSLWRELERWMLPGTPLSAAALAGNRVAVLLDTPMTDGPIIAVGSPGAGELRLHLVPLESAVARYNVSATGFAATPDGARLLVLISGFSASSDASELQSWLHILDAYTLTETCAPVELPGAGSRVSESLYPWRGNACWVATRVPGRDFAYATLVRLEEPAGQRISQYALTGAAEKFAIAADSRRDMVAIARDEHLELWPLGERGALGHRFDAPIRRMAWCDEGLLVGEAGRLHLVDPVACTPMRTIQFQSGWVTQWMVLPRESLPEPDADGDGLTSSREAVLGTRDDSADTDGDGIHDGVDPEPTRISPRLTVPGEIVLRGEAAGQEMRALLPDGTDARNASWNVSAIGENNAWLYRSQQTVDGRQLLILGVDPSHPVNIENALAPLQVSMQGRLRTLPAAGSPVLVPVQLAPPRRALRRILWVWPEDKAASFRDSSDPRGLRALGDLLSAPPLYFSHMESQGPYEGALDPYAVTILPIESAAEGVLTRQATLEYVRDGGSLLFLGRYLSEDAAPALSNWLSPLGIGINPGISVTGKYGIAAPEELARYWDQFGVVNGCAISFDGKAEALTGGAVFAAKRYGYGRVALLSAPTPLESGSLGNESNRTFAAHLFRWLANAAYEVQDLDGDLLPDETEDRNRNAHWDPGETDFLDADTDRDGLNDGIEDANRNGLYDDGETDSRNADSDGDSVLDAADPESAPLFGTPVIAALEPASGPAEGGTIATVSGRNFSADTNFWLGGAQVAWRRIVSPELAIIQTPGSTDDAGGWADFRVTGIAGQLEGALPNAFRYGERSVAAVELGIIANATTDGLARGVVRIRVSVSSSTIGGGAFLLRSDDPELAWGDATPGSDAPPGTVCSARPLDKGAILLTIMCEDGLRGHNRDWVQLPWSGALAKKPPHILVENAWLHTPWRTLLSVKVSVKEASS